MKFLSKRFINNLLSAVLCLFMFIFSFVFITALILRVENTAIIIRNIDITGVLFDTEIAYYMESQLNGLPFNNSYITLNEIENFIKSDAVSNEIGKVAGKYTSALSAGDFDYHITTGEVFELSKNLAPELYELFDHRMTEEDYGHFVRTLDDILDFRGLSINGLLEDFGINAAIPYLLLSPFLVWGTGIICILCLLLICLHHKSNIKSALIFAGIPVALSGLVYIAAGVITGFYPGLLSDSINRLLMLAGGFIILAVRYGIIFTTTGLLSVAAYFVVRYINRPCRQTQKSVLKSKNT